nr:MAG TPA: hypothetical protein [Caudoviricetes sp.]
MSMTFILKYQQIYSRVFVHFAYSRVIEYVL